MIDDLEDEFFIKINNTLMDLLMDFFQGIVKKKIDQNNHKIINNIKILRLLKEKRRAFGE